VRVFYPGASPERIETQIVNELEIKLREVEEIEELDSIISQGYASITVELQDNVHPDLIEQTWSMVQDKLSQFIAPSGVEIVLDRSSGPPITVQYAISWNGSGDAPIVMMSRLGNQLKRNLSSIGATHATAIYGETDEEIVVEVDTNKISSLGLTYGEISNALESFDNKRAAGVSFRLKDNIQSVQEVSEIPIKVVNNSEIIQLQDIATISKKPLSPIEDIFLYNGNLQLKRYMMNLHTLQKNSTSS